MLEVNGKKGKMLVCQDRECGYRKSISVITNARCPECKKKLELRGKGDGAIYVCPGSNCHFREKASQFKKRFDKSGKVDKREINNYMKKLIRLFLMLSWLNIIFQLLIFRRQMILRHQVFY